MICYISRGLNELSGLLLLVSINSKCNVQVSLVSSVKFMLQHVIKKCTSSDVDMINQIDDVLESNRAKIHVLGMSLQFFKTSFDHFDIILITTLSATNTLDAIEEKLSPLKIQIARKIQQ